MEHTFSVVLDIPEENLTAPLVGSLMVAVLDRNGIPYHSACITAETARPDPQRICVYCNGPLNDGIVRGAGTGRGQSFAHDPCYHEMAAAHRIRNVWPVTRCDEVHPDEDPDDGWYGLGDGHGQDVISGYHH